MSPTTRRLRLRNEEHGFTLIELMVVVLIIAILIAIAIPTFLGAKTRAQHKATQSSLRNALTNAKGIYTDSDSYTPVTDTALGLAEPSLKFLPTGGPSTGAKVVSVNNTATYIMMTALSASGTCFAIADWNTGGTFFAKITGACTGTQAAGAGTSVPTAAATSATSNNTWSSAW